METRELKKGTVIHIEGMPFQVSKDTVIEGTKRNFNYAGVNL